jgi:mono/diheme cytochrome c family protein
MNTLALKLIVGLAFSLPGVLIVLGTEIGEPVSPAQTTVTPTPTLRPKMGGGSDWILLDRVPPGSPQIEYGREIYRLACSACHGDKGQGLTTEWRMTWAPNDRNCWQSKCHGVNHPPDGFFLPYSPPVTKIAHSNRFPTALELQVYFQQTMPWEDPGSLLDERAWQVTAYVLKLNNINVGPVLNAETAAAIRLAPAPATPTPVPMVAAVSSGEESAPEAAEPAAPAIAPFFVAALLVIAGGVFLRRKARH